jgi:hypothetical protein
LNRLTHTLSNSLLQGNILPSRGPRHPQLAPFVLQVLFVPICREEFCYLAYDWQFVVPLNPNSCICFSLYLHSLSLVIPRKLLLLLITFLKTTTTSPPFLFPGGYCLAGSSAVTSCPAGVIQWDGHPPLLSSLRKTTFACCPCIVCRVFFCIACAEIGLP